MNVHAASAFESFASPRRVVVQLPTRERILAAARSLLRAYGYAGFTMEGVAAECGLTRRTLYNRFADRDALYRESRAELLGEFEDRLPRAIAAGDPVIAVERFVGLALDALAHPAHVELARSAEFDAIVFPWIVELYEDRVLLQLRQAIDRHIAQPGRAGRAHADDLVAMLCAAVHGARPYPIFAPSELAAIFLRRLSAAGA